MVTRKSEPMQPHELYRAGIEHGLAKKMSAVLGVGLQQVYRLGRPPEEDGSRTDLDRLELLLDLYGSHPEMRPTLRLARIYIESVFARVLDGEDASAVTGVSLARDGATVLREVSEFVATLDEPDQMDTMRALREGAEALNAIEAMLRRIIAMNAARSAVRAAS